MLKPSTAVPEPVPARKTVALRDITRAQPTAGPAGPAGQVHIHGSASTLSSGSSQLQDGAGGKGGEPVPDPELEEEFAKAVEFTVNKRKRASRSGSGARNKAKGMYTNFEVRRALSTSTSIASGI
jgi:hypothetical protein